MTTCSPVVIFSNSWVKFYFKRNINKSTVHIRLYSVKYHGLYTQTFSAHGQYSFWDLRSSLEATTLHKPTKYI